MVDQQRNISGAMLAMLAAKNMNNPETLQNLY